MHSLLKTKVLHGPILCLGLRYSLQQISKSCFAKSSSTITVMFLIFRTDRSWQNVLEEQSDQGLYCFAIPSASFGCITLRKSHFVQLLE